MGRDEFVALAYEAKRLTRLYQGKQPPGRRIEAKGAYFFTVLEGLVDRKGGTRVGRDPPRLAGTGKERVEPPPHRRRDRDD